jgi:hypothetical protein
MFYKAFIYLTYGLLIRLSTLILIKPLRNQDLLYKLITIRGKDLILTQLPIIQWVSQQIILILTFRL